MPPNSIEPKCPCCKQPLIRIRRKTLDRHLSRVLPVRRFQCIHHRCRWSGLRWVKPSKRNST